MNVYVIRFFDGERPARVEAVIQATDRFEAMDKTDEHREANGQIPVSLDPRCEVAEAMESDHVEEVFVV